MVETDANWTDAGTDELLATLHETGPEYGPVVAYQAGVDTDEAAGRFRVLRKRGLVERVSDEPCYRTTERGRRVVRDGRVRAAVDSRQSDAA